jgi:2-haloacid dehalogenase
VLLVFDAYGTLFDVHAVAAALDDAWPGHGDELATRLRAKQLEYSFLRGLMGRWVPFRQVTQDALLWAVESVGFAADPHTVDHVMAAYDLATAYPDVLPTLRALKAAHHGCVILTNGSRDMVSLAVEATEVDRHLDAVISVDDVERFKPDPEVYRLVERTTGIGPDRSVLVSANAFDVAGASSFGMRTCWVNRTGAVFDRLGVSPTYEVAALSELPALLG